MPWSKPLGTRERKASPTRELDLKKWGLDPAETELVEGMDSRGLTAAEL